jgi:hypothetical protein
MSMSRLILGALSATLLIIGAWLSYFAYLTLPYVPNPYQVAGSGTFWAGAFLLVAILFLDKTLKMAATYAQTRKGILVGGLYLTAHLLLYGFVLEGILVFLYGITPFISSSLVYLSSNILYPASLADAVFTLVFSPTINLQVPPYFEASLSFFSIFIAVIVDALILANIKVVSEIGQSGSPLVKSRAYLLMPLTGIILGGSCCMSLPLLLSVYLSSAASLMWAFYLTYFFLPPFAVVLLKLNLDLASRISAKVSSKRTF